VSDRGTRQRGVAAGPDDALYRLLVEGVGEYAIVALDPGGKVRIWNSGAERITGFSHSEAIGRALSFLYPDSSEEGGVEASVEEARLTGRSIQEGWRVRKDGGLFWASSVVTRLMDEQGQVRGYAAILRDLTDRKRASWAFEESRQRYRSLFEKNPDAVFSIDMDGRFSSANPAAERISGYSSEELLGISFAALISDDERAAVQEQFQAALGGVPQEIDTWILRKDGERVDLAMTVVPIVVHGEVVGVYGIAEDWTVRRRLEMEREVVLARESLARAQAESASQAKSTFLSIVSHELRTPLNVIGGYADLLLEGDAGRLSARQVRPLHRIRASADQLAQLIDTILSYTRMEPEAEELRLERVDLARLVREVVALAEPLAVEKGLSVRTRIPRSTVPLRIDSIKVRQALLNLLSNAIRFTEAGEIAILMRAGSERVEVEVRDTGIGIAGEHLEQIFEPFWQVEHPLTRTIGGAGLGLSVTRRIAEQLGGSVGVESDPGRGSAFTLILPVEDMEDSISA
jgi:PAS domain S-box-containing protein